MAQQSSVQIAASGLLDVSQSLENQPQPNRPNQVLQRVKEREPVVISVSHCRIIVELNNSKYNFLAPDWETEKKKSYPSLCPLPENSSDV